MKLEFASNTQPGEFEIDLKRKLERQGYKFVIQQGHKDDQSEAVVVDGQEVKVPFANIPNLNVAVKKNTAEQWEFVARNQELGKLLQEVKILENVKAGEVE